jgi:hypothetical protein
VDGASVGSADSAVLAVTASSSDGLSDAFLAGAFLDDFLAGGALASFSVSRRTTGASTVDDADRTNSPMSFNVLRTTLLSTPSSFASS